MIGIFDSGVGGLTVAKKIKEKNPNFPIIYFGDTARVPWGEKSSQNIQKYSEEICRFLFSKKVEKIVIACNTASSIAGNYLRKKFPDKEFIDVIFPTIEKIKEIHQKVSLKKIAVIGTKNTISSHYYYRKIKKEISDVIVMEKACPLFVPLVEEGWHKEQFVEKIAEKYLKEIKKWQPDILILGCTHYPLLKNIIKKNFSPKTKIIDSAEPVADYFKKNFKKQLQKKNCQDQFYFSDLSDHYKKLTKMIMRKEIRTKQISF